MRQTPDTERNQAEGAEQGYRFHIAGKCHPCQRQGGLPGPHRLSVDAAYQQAHGSQSRRPGPEIKHGGDHPARAGNMVPGIERQHTAGGHGSPGTALQPGGPAEQPGQAGQDQAVENLPHPVRQPGKPGHESVDDQPGRPDLIMPQQELGPGLHVQHRTVVQIIVAGRQRQMVQGHRQKKHTENHSQPYPAALCCFSSHANTSLSITPVCTRLFRWLDRSRMQSSQLSAAAASLSGTRA